MQYKITDQNEDFEVIRSLWPNWTEKKKNLDLKNDLRRTLGLSEIHPSTPGLVKNILKVSSASCNWRTYSHIRNNSNDILIVMRCRFSIP